MATVLQARPRQFVNTPYIERITRRALRYLQSGFAVHLRGPSGTGKTTLAMHLASLLGRPIMLIYGDDRFDSSDLIGGRTGFTHRRVVDNFIHSVVKTEEDVQQRWVDARLTLACREGFTLIYDEFNRSRPEANNALLSAWRRGCWCCRRTATARNICGCIPSSGPFLPLTRRNIPGFTGPKMRCWIG